MTDATAGAASGGTDDPTSGGATAPETPVARLWISWLLVAILLGYGIYQTATTAAKLFTS
jgi:hypothetical protein